jgi:hypothetical protein
MAALKNNPALETGQVTTSRLEVVVLHTGPKETVGALKMAADLACGLAPVRLLAVQQVPYPLGLDAPPVSVHFLEKSLTNMTSEADVNPRIDIRLGRDAQAVIESQLGPHCIVVIGGRRRPWPTSATRLARRLERLGHEVVFAN